MPDQQPSREGVTGTVHDESIVTFLVEIPPDECAELLASAKIGRLGVVVEGRPEIFPVNHVVEEETGAIVFPTRPGTKLHGALGWPWVAFEVDGMDPESGWSVMVVGRAEEVAEADVRRRAASQRSILWAGGADAVWVRIVPEKVTGRRISAQIV